MEQSRVQYTVEGGPLDGNSYELRGEIGSTVELTSAAGVGIYRFTENGDGETVLEYLGPSGLGSGEAPTEGSEF